MLYDVTWTCAGSGPCWLLMTRVLRLRQPRKSATHRLPLASTSPAWNVRRAACYWTTGSTSYAGWGAARWRPQKRRAGRAPIPTLGLAVLHEEVVARCLHRDREAVRHAWVVTRPALRGRAAVEAMLQALQAAAATAATHSGAGAVTGRRRLS